jgi:hypothetical protein
MPRFPSSYCSYSPPEDDRSCRAQLSKQWWHLSNLVSFVPCLQCRCRLREPRRTGGDCAFSSQPCSSSSSSQLRQQLLEPGPGERQVQRFRLAAIGLAAGAPCRRLRSHCVGRTMAAWDGRRPVGFWRMEEGQGLWGFNEMAFRFDWVGFWGKETPDNPAVTCSFIAPAATAHYRPRNQRTTCLALPVHINGPSKSRTITHLCSKIPSRSGKRKSDLSRARFPFPLRAGVGCALMIAALSTR